MFETDTYIVPTREGADALSALFRHYQNRENAMTVANLKQALDLPAHYTDMSKGWLKSIEPVFKSTDGGYQLILPEPVPLKWVSA